MHKTHTCLFLCLRSGNDDITYCDYWSIKWHRPPYHRIWSKLQSQQRHTLISFLTYVCKSGNSKYTAQYLMLNARCLVHHLADFQMQNSRKWYIVALSIQSRHLNHPFKMPNVCSTITGICICTCIGSLSFDYICHNKFLNVRKGWELF